MLSIPGIIFSGRTILGTSTFGQKSPIPLGQFQLRITNPQDKCFSETSYFTMWMWTRRGTHQEHRSGAESHQKSKYQEVHASSIYILIS